MSRRLPLFSKKSSVFFKVLNNKPLFSNYLLSQPPKNALIWSFIVQVPLKCCSIVHTSKSGANV